jgi:hypothetical protein
VRGREKAEKRETTVKVTEWEATREQEEAEQKQLRRTICLTFVIFITIIFIFNLLLPSRYVGEVSFSPLELLLVGSKLISLDRSRSLGKCHGFFISMTPQCLLVE